MLRLVLLLSTLHLARSTCPADYDVYRDGECRGGIFNKDQKNCSPGFRDGDCAKLCTSRSLTPPNIRSDEDQSYWAERARSTNLYVWLALYCNTASKRWEWYDGSPVDYKPPVYDEELEEDCYYKTGYWSGFAIVPGDGKWQFSVSSAVAIPCTGRVPRLEARDDGIAQNPMDGLLYQISSTEKSWHDAQEACQKQGDELASIHNPQTNYFIRQSAISDDAPNGLFLGASQLDGNLTWSDGSDWDYANADADAFPREEGDCLAMDTFDYTGQWFNTDCASELPYACVKADPMITGPWVAGQNITSPGYPYDASIPANYLLAVPTGLFVEVTIEELQANSCCDFLVLSDEEKGRKLVAKLSGQMLPEDREKNKFTSKSNFMKVSWQPKGANNVKGFRLTYRSVSTFPTTTVKASTAEIKTSASGNIIPQLLHRQRWNPAQLRLHQALFEGNQQQMAAIS